MPLSFPDNPSDGDRWGRWLWDGDKWTFPPATPAEPPVGEIIDWPSDLPPDAGWLVLDGRAANKRRNAALFAKIGTRFGEPSPYLFALPDLRGQLLVGLDPDATGRITIMDVAALWEQAGTLLVSEHDHTASGGTHAHTLVDPSHLHGVNQPGGHGHGFHDPGHAHSTWQNHHSHGLSDPTHGHGKPDPSHTHLQGHTQDWRRSLYDSFWYTWPTFGVFGVSGSGGGNWNDAAGTGVNCLGDNAWIWVDGAGTGLHTGAANANIDNYGAYTGLTMNPVVTGIANTALNPGVDNMQPRLEVVKLVRARGGVGVGADNGNGTNGRLDFPTGQPAGTIFGAYLWDGVKWDRRPHNLSPGGTRIGTIIDWTDWPDTPPRYMICDGRELSRIEHPRLYFHLGDTHGDGDGLTTFNLPDTRARVTVGIDVGGTSGRMTVTISGINAGLIGAAGGDERLGSHTHPHVAVDPGHAHSLNDPGHTHGVWQTAHNHGWGDPTHAHGLPQNNHGHGQSAGHHNHGWQGGWHFHYQHHGWYNNHGWIDYAVFLAVVWGNHWISYAHSGISNHGAGIGVWTGGNFAWIDIHGAGTGQWVDASPGADVGFHWGGTNVTVHNADAATGLVVEVNDSESLEGNIAPSVVLPKLIYAGVDYA